MTLREFAEKYGITYLWIAGQACPTGYELRQNVGDNVADEDWCEIDETELFHLLADLEGDVDDNGRWNWNGEGDPVDERGNSIHSVCAGWAQTQLAN